MAGIKQSLVLALAKASTAMTTTNKQWIWQLKIWAGQNNDEFGDCLLNLVLIFPPNITNTLIQGLNAHTHRFYYCIVVLHSRKV